jgi:hypothetical protein
MTTNNRFMQHALVTLDTGPLFNELGSINTDLTNLDNNDAAALGFILFGLSQVVTLLGGTPAFT